MPNPPSAAPAAPAPDLRVEAARYALLRRLAFAMRHEMVVNLQPIGLIAEVMDRRLQMPTPDLVRLQESMAKIQGLARAASRSCLDVITWLAPVPGTPVALDAGVNECLAQLRGSFSFRGVLLQADLQGPAVPVARAGLRHVLPAALLALTDTAPAPARMNVSADISSGQAVLSLQLEDWDGSPGFAGDAPYRQLAWEEVEALAQADGITATRTGRTARLVMALLPAAPT